MILYPTDTVWGIGCDATRAEAVARVYAIKRREDHKAMLALVDSTATLERWVEEVPEAARQLIDVAVKPMTIIYDHGRGFAPALLGPDGSIGIRVTSEPVSQALCRGLRRPLVSTSANISGEPAARCFAEISPEVIAAVDYVMESRRDEPPTASPSTVMKVGDDNTIQILRP